MVRQTGVIARLVRDRGFGFVRADDGHEYFFHRNNIVPDDRIYPLLQDGMRASWDVEPHGKRGPRAVNVEIESRTGTGVNP